MNYYGCLSETYNFPDINNITAIPGILRSFQKFPEWPSSIRYSNRFLPSWVTNRLWIPPPNAWIIFQSNPELITGLQQVSLIDIWPGLHHIAPILLTFSLIWKRFRWKQYARPFCSMLNKMKSYRKIIWLCIVKHWFSMMQIRIKCYIWNRFTCNLKLDQYVMQNYTSICYANIQFMMQN